MKRQEVLNLYKRALETFAVEKLRFDIHDSDAMELQDRLGPLPPVPELNTEL